MIGKLDQALRFHQTALSLRAERQQVLASNIANADTPNYKARDVDFNAALKQAIGPGAMPATPVSASASVASAGAGKAAANPLAVALSRTSAAHLSGNAGTTTANGAQMMYRQTAVQGNVDGNTVDMDVERNQFTDNALRYEAGITFASGQIKTLLTAVTGQ
ncbi:flagellar basal body rod protein FlgB [Noviherbaspirillum sp. CPCC 100848]|uniref:Flagellar basal body rod protein FlgB n=1 Tax=Noviherbaspirillum album TaxID=3080276 RepID=A0ABU6JDI6_9BURK|nr:flagellar basal body rod protein FlgB [Noviherbaspirillum sp. CPCC 100848]MEC4721375.1 flagellar basal body rod protein FlgB [Noviherbaspirillum sp. CPCC 100848]